MKVLLRSSLRTDEKVPSFSLSREHQRHTQLIDLDCKVKGKSWASSRVWRPHWVVEGSRCRRGLFRAVKPNLVESRLSLPLLANKVPIESFSKDPLPLLLFLDVTHPLLSNLGGDFWGQPMKWSRRVIFVVSWSKENLEGDLIAYRDKVFLRLILQAIDKAL